MKRTKQMGVLLALLGSMALGACADMNPPPYAQQTRSTRTVIATATYGVVQSIEAVQPETRGIGLGTIAGAVVGGVLGNQVGAGSGNTAATVIGAAGGAYVGHEIENRQPQNSDGYRVTVRMEDGSIQSLTLASAAGFRVGDRVRLRDGVLERY